MLQIQDRSIARTLLVGKRFRLGARRLTRAHLAFARRPELRAQLNESFTAAAAALSAELRCPVQASASILEATVVPSRSLAQQGAFVLVELSAVGGVAVVELELPFLLSVVARLSGAREAPKAPSRLTRIEEAASSFLLLTMIQSLRGNAFIAERLSPRLLSIASRRSEALDQLASEGPHLPVEIRLDVGGSLGVMRMLLPARLLQSAAHSVPPRLPALNSALAAEVGGAGFSCRRFVGSARLCKADVHALARGDVVLLDGLRVEAGCVLGVGRVEGPTFSLAGAFQAPGFLPNRAFPRAQPQERPMSEEYEDTAALPIDVEIELTRVRISLAELATLRPGQLLPLQINVSEPVTVRIGDRAIAKAELVEIEGEVGARILALLPASVLP